MILPDREKISKFKEKRKGELSSVLIQIATP
jgi:hypothetical protein